MKLFKPIWENKDPERILKAIDNGYYDEKLSKIALNCAFPECRKAAAHKIKQPAVKVATMKAALQNGDLETALLLKNSNSRTTVFKYSDLLSVDVVIEDAEILTKLALKVDTLREWKKYEAKLDPLLESDQSGVLVSHYNELKRMNEEEKKKRAEEKEMREKKKIERERKKRELEAKEKRQHDYHWQPRAVLEKYAGKPSEKKYWDEYFDYWMSERYNRILMQINEELKDLSWCDHFPTGVVSTAVMNAEGYGGEHSFYSKKAEEHLNYFLQALFEQREDLRDEILSLNKKLFFEGEEGCTVNFGDHHEDWFVHFDPIPTYRLFVTLIDDQLQISLSEEPLPDHSSGS